MKSCKFGVSCLCDGCEANDGHYCKVRQEPTCSGCTRRQYIRITKCTDKETIEGGKNNE